MKKSRRFLPKKRKRGKTFLACFYQTKKSIPATFLSSMCALGLKGWDLLPLCRSAHWWRIDDIDCDDNGEDNHNDDGDGIDGEDNDEGDDEDRRFPSDEDEINLILRVDLVCWNKYIFETIASCGSCRQLFSFHIKNIHLPFQMLILGTFALIDFCANVTQVQQFNLSRW